jgi:Uma2 family endonuclease
LTAQLLTFEEFERLPEILGKQELLNGEVVESPLAKKKHVQQAHSFFLAMLGTVEASIGKPHIRMGYRVRRDPDSWLVPDVSITHPDQAGEDYPEGAPLLAVEIISPSNSDEQIERKRKLYLENGGVEVWVVYPKTKSVWVFRAGHAEEFTDQLRTDIIPGLSINIGQLLA